MKKMILAFLLITGTATTLPAQYNPYYYYEPYTTAAEALFNNPRPGKAKVNFNFYTSDGGMVRLELVSIKQMEHLPNLDSILTVAKSSVQKLSDSLKEDAINRKIDVFIDANKPVQLRITSHTNRSPSFFVQNDELAILKTDMDTLRVKFMVPTGRKMTYTINGKRESRIETAPAFIMIIMNDFGKLRSLPPDIMQSCLALLRQDISSSYVTKASAAANYAAFYDLSKQKRHYPSKEKWIRNGGFRNEVVPNIYNSFQFVRGSFAPSISVGLRFSTQRTTNRTSRFYLMFEKYYLFSRDSAKRLTTDANTFITFRYIDDDANDRKNGGFDYIGNISLGYLAKRNGDWFEKNSFKLGLPGVRSGWLQLEPEFYFNNFFKNMTPTLKLTLHYE